MTEPVIAAAGSAVVQAAVKALAPEAEQLLGELHTVASEVTARIDQVVPELLAKAENESAIALRTAQQHLAALLHHVAGVLHLEPVEQLPEGEFATPSGPAVNVPAGSVQLGTGAVDPTAAPEAPTQS